MSGAMPGGRQKPEKKCPSCGRHPRTHFMSGRCRPVETERKAYRVPNEAQMSVPHDQLWQSILLAKALLSAVQNGRAGSSTCTIAAETLELEFSRLPEGVWTR